MITLARTRGFSAGNWQIPLTIRADGGSEWRELPESAACAALYPAMSHKFYAIGELQNRTSNPLGAKSPA
jgi:hypothetical protein